MRTLEEKLQITLNAISKLIAKQKEDEKQLKGLESKFASTKALCDQLTETSQLLRVKIQHGECELMELRMAMEKIEISLRNEQDRAVHQSD